MSVIVAGARLPPPRRAKRHRIGDWLVTAGGVASLALMAIVNSAFASGETPATAATGDSDVALVIDGSGSTAPAQEFVDSVTETYIDPNFFGDYVGEPVVMPLGLYPATGVNSLPLDTSVDQGLDILDSAISQHHADGDDSVVLGYSQSAAIASLEMAKLADSDQAPDPDQLGFVLLADPMNPDGGLLARFPGLELPSLGFDFYGATPADTPYDTDIYTGEYDGFADFPTYPLNLLADLNAVAGIATVHPTYPDLSEDQVDDAILLPGSAEATDYYMLPSDTLPLLAPIEAIPVLGEPISDLLEPELRVLVNLGYGNIEHGWDPGPADEPTEFGLFPDVDPEAVFAALADGAEQGVADFTDDLASLDLGASPESDGDDGDAQLPDASDLPSLTEIADAFASAASSAYGALLPTADILNAVTTSFPAYGATLLTDALADGDVIAAFGDPLAAGTGLVTVAAGFELAILADAAGSVGAAVGDLF